MISPDAELLSSLERTVRRQRLFRPGDTLVVALSGGADSTALLDLLCHLPGFNLRLIAAHLNHCLRGAESDADEEFCREAASRYGITFEMRRIDVKNMASENRLNLEDAGRRARIDFLDEIRGKYGATAVALAHHADDQAETVLMRLLRGSGAAGLSGMAYRNDRGFVRPLLEISRSAIERYLNGRGLGWRDDASNSDTAFLRNRVRHQLLPLLEEYNPAIRTCLASTASILGDDEALLEELTQKAFSEICRAEEGKIVCGVGQLRALNPALRRRVLRRAFKLLVGTLEGVSLRHIDSLCDLIASGRPNSSLALPHGVTAVREYDLLSLVQSGETLHRLCSATSLRLPSCTRGASRPAAVLDAGFEMTISEPGCYLLPCGGSITVEAAASATFPEDPSIVCFDPAGTPFPWLVRTFRPGDRITPLGMKGRKKLKDIFIDRKIPRSERTRIPLLFRGDDLIWIAGVCASELCRVDDPSAATVRVTWRGRRDVK